MPETVWDVDSPVGCADCWLETLHRLGLNEEHWDDIPPHLIVAAASQYERRLLGCPRRSGGPGIDAA